MPEACPYINQTKLQVTMKTFYFPIIGLLLIMIAGGCGEIGADRGAREALERADAVLDAMPDSAMAIIAGIDTTRLNTERLRADYSLLRTMALLKTNSSAATEEGLKAAYDYYGDSDEPSRQTMLTHFAKGCFADSIRESVVEYGKTSELASGVNATLYRAMASLNLASDLANHKNAAKARTSLDVAAKYLKEINDTARQIHYAIVSGKVHNAMGEFADAENDLLAGMHLADLVGDSMRMDDINMILSRAYEGIGRYGDGVGLIEKTLDRDKRRFTNSDAMVYARLLAYTGNAGRAKEVFAIVRKDSTDSGRTDYHFTESEILASEGDVAGAYRLLRDSVLAFGNRVVADRYRFSSDAEMLALETELREKNEKLAASSARETYYIAALLFVVVVVGLRFVRNLKARYRKELESRNAEAERGKALLGETIAGLEKELEESVREKQTVMQRLEGIEIEKMEAMKEKDGLEVRIRELEKENSGKEEANDALKTELEHLRQSRSVLTQRLKEADREIGMVKESQLRQFRALHGSISRFCVKAPKDCKGEAKKLYDMKRERYLQIYKAPGYLDNLEKEVDMLMDGIISTLRDELHQNTLSLRIAVLDICGFDYKCIGEILGEKSKTVSARRSKLKDSIFASDEANIEKCRRYMPVMAA